jgi:hypothetical protein
MQRRSYFMCNELSYSVHYGLLLPQSFHWYSAFLVGMLYADRVNAEK